MKFWELTHDQRTAMAKDSPEEFEALWKDEVVGVKAEQTMWKAQASLKKYKNNTMRCTEAGKMMAESFKELNELLQVFRSKKGEKD